METKLCFRCGGPCSPVPGPSGYVNTSRVSTGRGQRSPVGVSCRPALGFPERACDHRHSHRGAHPLCSSRDLSSSPALVLIVHGLLLRLKPGVWSEASLNIQELPRCKGTPGQLGAWSAPLHFQHVRHHLKLPRIISFGFGVALSRLRECVKLSWSESLENSCPPLAWDKEHETWPHSQRGGCCQMGSSCERPRGSHVGSHSQASVSRH